LEAQSFVDYSTLSPEELARTCFRSGDEKAWSEFVRRFNPLIARVVFRVARQWGETSPQVVDDLIQDTYLKLCADRVRFLENFTPARPDAIYGYLKVFTANLAHDRFKESRSRKRGGMTSTTSIEPERTGLALRDERSTEASLERKVLIQQIDACLKVVCSGPNLERDRKIFWLYFRSGLAASAIAQLPSVGLTTKGVESTLLRLTRQIRARMCDRGETPTALEGIQPADSF
jgi:RNA polymerase sigma-70 factor (ECF subfamily)